MKNRKGRYSMSKLLRIYNTLLKEYGPQGWWPVMDFFQKENSEPSKKRLHKPVTEKKSYALERGYHPGDYSYPKTDKQKLEIILGAILTQNTSWKNAKKALINLNKKDLIYIKKLEKIPQEELEEIIRPSGFFRQKARSLKLIAEFLGKNKDPTREELLEIKGIGHETADSILLYAFQKPEFVVDAYTKRIFSRIGLIDTENYEKIKTFFQENLKAEIDEKGLHNADEVSVYNEFHALIVEHAKRFCRKKPRCENCYLNNICEYPKSR